MSQTMHSRWIYMHACVVVHVCMHIWSLFVWIHLSLWISRIIGFRNFWTGKRQTFSHWAPGPRREIKSHYRQLQRSVTWYHFIGKSHSAVPTWYLDETKTLCSASSPPLNERIPSLWHYYFWYQLIWLCYLFFCWACSTNNTGHLKNK